VRDSVWILSFVFRGKTTITIQSNSQDASGSSADAAAGAARDGMAHSLRGSRSRMRIALQFNNQINYATFVALPYFVNAPKIQRSHAMFWQVRRRLCPEARGLAGAV
jgi:hypothetical protein